MDLLWRDVEEAKARNAFRQALHRLRNAVGDDILPQDRERLRLVKSGRLTIDLERFHSAANAARFEDAVELYGGDFLQDAVLGEPAYDLWVEQERVRMRAVFRGTLERAMSQASTRGDWNRAVAHARRLMQLVPYEPEAAQLAAATMVSAGQARDARELLARFAARREAELGVGVPPEIKALMARLERPREGPDDDATATVPGATLTFAGRESEMARLLTLWRTVREDAGALALIEGDAGIGKSRLAHELASHARALRAGTILVARERASPTPLGLFADALRPLVRAPGIAGASPHLLAEAARLLPELRDGMQLPPVSDVEDEAARLRFFEGIAALIDAAAYERPLMLILEDVHHIAPSSLDLLTYLAARLVGSQVMFVLTMRPNGTVATRVRALSEASDVSVPAHGARALRLDLPPLSDSASREAIGVAGRAGGMPAPVLEQVCMASQGIPGRLSDLMKRVSAGEDISAPADALAMFARRLERLSSAHRRVFVVIALLRRPVDLEVLASAAHLSRPATRDAVGVLEIEGLVEVTNDHRVSAVETAAQAAIEAAGSDARAFLSRWIAAALTDRPDADHAELARHFAAGGEAPRAFQSYRRAAFDSLALGASVEAVTFLSFARSFATTPEQQSEVEGLLSGLGSGRKRLADAESSITASQPVAPAVVATGSPWMRLFPNWRLLLGAAVATLLISTLVLWRTAARPPAAPGVPPDTLILAEGEPVRALRFVTFEAGMRPIVSLTAARAGPEPAWIDSLPRMWTNPLASPRATHVALSKATATGSDVFVISFDRRDTVALTSGNADARPLGWSPDGRWVLASTTRTLPDGSHDSDLFAFSLSEPGRRVVIDSVAGRAIVEARWSPEGVYVAWVARIGDDRQLEVFISQADGSARRNVSRDPADDYHIAWSSDGELLAFTSMRDGNAELYAFGLTDGKTWRLTRDAAQDDWASYSSNGRLIAFESTRGGAAGVYVMPGLGGEAARIRSSLPLSIREWRSGPQRYLDGVRVASTAVVRPGETARLRVIALDQLGDSMSSRTAQLRLLDSSVARLAPADSATGWTLTASRTGMVRVIVSAGGWRSDTAGIPIGREPLVLLQGSDGNFDRWMPLGKPGPSRAATGGLMLNSDREWDSGILSREPVPLLPGLTFSAVLETRGSGAQNPAAAFSVALVAPEPSSAIEPDAPQFLKYASVSWNAEARRLVYAVGREVFTEAVGAQLSGDLAITIRVQRDSTVSFDVDGRQHWHSSLRIITQRSESRVQAWISGRATGPHLVVREARISLAGAETR